MPREESLYPADWLRIAEKELGRVEHLLGVSDPEAAGFYLQQAVEKCLKAFLLSKGWDLECFDPPAGSKPAGGWPAHDLGPLLNEALTHDPSLEQFRLACQKITGFYFVERYLFITEAGLTEDDIRDSLTRVKGLIEKLRAAVVGE